MSSTVPPAASSRDTQRLQWARTTSGRADLTLLRASTDAGFRSYWRTQGDAVSQIVMDSPPDKEDVRPWLHIHALLDRHAVRVPAIAAADAKAGFLLLEDLGGPTLAQAITADNADVWFDAAIDQLLKIQRIAPDAQMARFNEALLQRDAGLFEQWFLQRHLGLTLDCAHVEQLQLVQRRLMDNALAQPQVLVHRDFMPRNLMPVDDGLAVLDFQDMVVGPVAYDVISLFKDAFLSWPLAQVDTWLAHYHQRASDAGITVPPLATFQRDADWLGVQRHLKILGIFARLHYRDGKSRYLADVPRFVSYLDEILPRYTSLAPLAELLEQQIKPALAARGALV